MEKMLASMYIYIYQNLFASTKTYEKLTTYSDAIMTTLEEGGVLHNFYLTLRILAFGMLTVYFIITIGTRMEGRENSPSVMFKTFLQFFVGYALALFSFDIVKWTFMAGDFLAAAVENETIKNIGDLSPYFKTLERSAQDIEFFAQVTYIFKALIPYAVCFISNLILMYSIITRVLRICVNATLSPIAVANYFEGTRRSDAVKFLKRTLSMGLQCSLIMVITIATGNMATIMTTDYKFSSSMNYENEIVKAQKKMVDSLTVNMSLIQARVEQGYNRRPYKEKQESPKPDTVKAALSSNIDKVTEANEQKYMEYEEYFEIKLFERTKDGSHYLYNDDGYAKLRREYYKFSGDSVAYFLNVILGNGHYWLFILMIIVRIGMIKQANSLCNTIVGL